jgi:hypothetical protein
MEKTDKVRIVKSNDSSLMVGTIVPEWQFFNACEYLESIHRTPPIGEKVATLDQVNKILAETKAVFECPYPLCPMKGSK